MNTETSKPLKGACCTQFAVGVLNGVFVFAKNPRIWDIVDYRQLSVVANIQFCPHCGAKVQS